MSPLLGTSNPDWSSLTPKSRACLERLSTHTPRPISLSSYPASKLAAVLVLLYEEESRLRVLLTTRAKSLRSHPFQTALPGGKLEPNDADFVEAAFREAYEEVGLPLDCPHIYVLCHLRPFLSLYKLLVTPVVAILTDLSVLEALIPSHDEVDHVFDHPLEAFLDPDLAAHERLSTMGEENWPYDTENYSTEDKPAYFGVYRMHRFRSSYTPIKGLTADILITTAEIAYDRKPSFVRLAPDQLDGLTKVSRAIKEHEEAQVTALANSTRLEGFVTDINPDLFQYNFSGMLLM